MISKALEWLEGLYAEVIPECIAIFNRQSREFKALEGMSTTFVEDFAKKLSKEITKRFTRDQIMSGL